MKIGAVCHPISVTFNGNDLVYALTLVEAKAFLCPTFHHKTSFEDQILSVVDQVPSLSPSAIAVIDKKEKSHSSITLNEIISAYEPYDEKPKNTSDDITLILMTSGTTGRPKAVLFTHNSLSFSAKTFNKRLHLTRDDIVFMPAPMNHATGFKFGLIAPLLLGGSVVFQHEFNAREAMDIIVDEGVTWSMGATPFVLDLFNCAEENNLSFGSMKLYVCGGAAVPSSMVKRAAEHAITLCECYGSTESSPHVIVPPECSLEWDGAYSGIACDGVEVKIVDNQGNEVPYGVQGDSMLNHR